MIFVLHGEETFLKERKLKQLKQKYPVSMPEINEVTLSFTEHPFDIIIQECEAIPFFSEYRFVIFKNAYFLTSSTVRKALKEEEVTVLFKKIKEADSSTIFVFFQESLDSRKKIVKNLKKEAEFLEFKPLNDIKLRSSIQNAFKSRNTTIEEEALELLMKRVPHQLLQIEREVEKLSLAGSLVTYDMVDTLISKPIEENVFELSNSILQRDQKKAFAIYKDLMLKNEEPIKLIVMIANSMRLLYQVMVLDRKGYNDQEIAKYLAINVYRLRYIRQDKASYDINDLLYFINELAILDTAIKQGKIDKKLGFELFLMKL